MIAVKGSQNGQARLDRAFPNCRDVLQALPPLPKLDRPVRSSAGATMLPFAVGRRHFGSARDIKGRYHCSSNSHDVFRQQTLAEHCALAIAT